MTDLSTRSVWVRLAAPHLYRCELSELRDLIQKGEQKAACALYDRHKRPLARFAFYLSENEKKAQKLVQQAFLDLFTAIKSRQNNIDIEAWPYRHVVNHYLQQFPRLDQSRDFDHVKRAFRLSEAEVENLATKSRAHLLAILTEMTPSSRAKFLIWVLSDLHVDQQAWVFDTTPAQWRLEWEEASFEALDWSRVIQLDQEEGPE